MYELRHLLANIVTLSIVILLSVSLNSLMLFSSNFINFNIYTNGVSSSLMNSFILFITILILIAFSSILISIMFSSILISIIYYITTFAYASLMFSGSYYYIISSILVNLFTYYIFVVIILALILGLTRRTFPDEIILNLNRMSLKFNKSKIIYGVLFILISYFLFIYLKFDMILFIGSIISSILYVLISRKLEFPLILLSWFSIPYIVTNSIDFSLDNKGIELGEIEGILSPTILNRISQTRFGLKKVSSLKFYLNFDKSKNYNILIIGTSGSGKSTLAKEIISKLTGISYLVFDLHGEYDIENAIKIDMSKTSLNPLSLNGTSPRQRALEIAYMLRSIFKLGNLQTIDIFNIIMEAYAEKGIDENDERTWTLKPPTFHDVLITLEKRKKLVENSQDLSRISSIEPYIQFLTNQILSNNSINMEEIFKKNIVLDFSRVTTDELKYILIETILRDFRNYLNRRGISNLWKFLIIDEAPFILSKETGLEIVERLFAEVRKFGVGIILITQITENIENIFQNSSYVFIFNVIEPKELDYLSKALGGSSQEKYMAIYEIIKSLDRAHVVTIAGDNRDILLVKLNSLKISGSKYVRG